MGSGRGLSRRTRAAASQLVFVDEANPFIQKWRDFIKQVNTEKLSLAEYYGVTTAGAEAVAQIAEEVLKDLISIGALILPSGVQSQDLSVEHLGTSGGYALKFKGRFGALVRDDRSHSSLADTSLYSQISDEMIYELGDALSRLSNLRYVYPRTMLRG